MFNVGSHYVPEVTPDFFIQSILECEKASEYQKRFGSIHGYHGTSAKFACESNGGIFSYITRNPIDRINSAFVYYANPWLNSIGLKVSNSATNEFVNNLFSDKALHPHATHVLSAHVHKQNTDNRFRLFKQSIKRFIPTYAQSSYTHLKSYLPFKTASVQNKSFYSDQEIVNYLLVLFYSLTDSFYSCDHQLLVECDRNQGIKMEEMVSSPIYFASQVFPRIDKEITPKDSYVKSVFSQGRHGIHRDSPINTSQIWESMPSLLRDTLLERFYHYSLSDLCNHFDYSLPL